MIFLDEDMNEQFENHNNGEREIHLLKENARKKRGRGFELNSVLARNAERIYDKLPLNSVDDVDDNGPKRSVEGWILFVNNIHEEAEENDLYEKFAAFGPVKNVHLNLDRRTGYIKGYALIEYETFKEAMTAKIRLNKSQLLGQEISVDWCFVKHPKDVPLAGHRTRRY